MTKGDREVDITRTNNKALAKPGSAHKQRTRKNKSPVD